MPAIESIVPCDAINDEAVGPDVHAMKTPAEDEARDG